MARKRYEKTPHVPSIITEYANALVANGRLDEAMKVLEKGMATLPQNGYLPLVAGDLAVLKGERKTVARFYARAETVKIDDPNHLINIAARYVACSYADDNLFLPITLLSMICAIRSLKMNLPITRHLCWGW